MKSWEHFIHSSDIGVRGFGETREEAFEQAAVALTGVVGEIDTVAAAQPIEIRCMAADDELLLVEWLNALVFEMATRRMLFSRFQVRLDHGQLTAKAWGEHLDREKHQPAVEVKGATFTELAVRREPSGRWVAQCVVDV